MSSADEIRAKRLAKMSGARASSSESLPKPKPPPSQESTPKAEQPKVVESPAPQPSVAKVPEAVATPTPKPAPIAVDPSIQLSNWLLNEIEVIFKASTKESDSSLIFLESLLSDLTDSSANLDSSVIESIFMEILTSAGIPPSISPSSMEYLYQIYSKTFQLKRILQKRDALYEKKLSIYNDIIQFSCSFALICFQEDDLFLNNSSRESLVLLFVHRSNEFTTFLIDIVNKAIEQDSLSEFLGLFVPILSTQLHKVDISKREYSAYLTIYEALVGIKAVAGSLSEIDGFEAQQESDPLSFEHTTILGGILKLSPLQIEVAASYFGNDVSKMPPVQINQSYESVQNENKVLLDRQFFILDKLVRGSPTTRNSIMKFFGKLVNLNHLRRGSHAELQKLSSDGLMFNIAYILIRLSLPFLGYPSFSKLDKIDIDYIGKTNQGLVEFGEETRVNSSVQEANDFYKQNLKDADNANFISDCFYLTLSYLHYGVGGIYLHYDRIKSQIKQMEQRIELLSNPNGPPPPGTNPAMLQFFRAQLPNLMKSLNGLKSYQHIIQAIFNHRVLQLEIFDFVIGATTFIVRIIDKDHSYPKTKISIPIFQIENVGQLDDQEFLKSKSPIPWKFFPEFIIEGIINYCAFISKFRGNPLYDNAMKVSSFIEFTIVLLRCPELIGNPHMKSNLIELLFYGSLPMNDGSPGYLVYVFNTNQLVINNILYSLLDIYVTVEKTGASSQFYDKFNSRYYISVILEELWKNETYRQQLTQFSKSNVDFFVRFIARMLNDTTYLLDESFNELNSIHNYEQEYKRRVNGQEPNEELGTSEELAENLSRAQRNAKSYMGLSNKTIELFKLFTKEVPQGFLLPEIVGRLASMLNYNLTAMVGPKCSNLKVDNPLKYDFDPKRTLSDLTDIYCNLSTHEKFVTAVARDGRSFNYELFVKADRILSTRTYTTPKTLEALRTFAKNAEQKRQEDEDEELELGEVPDEFLDPLMFTLMEDPVKLPSSKISIDRSTIKSHLLSDPTDPFNRMPLKLEDVVDDEELKAKIEEFKRQKKAERKADVVMKE